MPAKVYLESPGRGDFRAMPARGDGLALLKWITSFPGNPADGLPAVTGIVVLSDAENGQPLALLDARSVTALRTGRGGGGGLAGAGCFRGVVGRCRGVRPARGVDGALPGRRRVVGGGVLRRVGFRFGVGRSRRGLVDRLVEGGDLGRCGLLRHAGVVGRPGRRRRPTGGAFQHARRRRAGEGRGVGRRRAPVLALLRRVGPGVARRRAHRARWRRAACRPATYRALGAVLAGSASGRTSPGDDAVRLDRAGDPGSRRGRRRVPGVAGADASTLPRSSSRAAAPARAGRAG